MPRRQVCDQKGSNRCPSISSWPVCQNRGSWKEFYHTRRVFFCCHNSSTFWRIYKWAWSILLASCTYSKFLCCCWDDISLSEEEWRDRSAYLILIAFSEHLVFQLYRVFILRFIFLPKVWNSCLRWKIYTHFCQTTFSLISRSMRRCECIKCLGFSRQLCFSRQWDGSW